jgi:DNA-binding NtrC family response regulator
MGTILFVDDHHAFRTVMGEVLRLRGYTVLEGGTIADADHIVEHHSRPIDLLVVEAELTTTNGVEVVRHLASHYPQLPVLYISEKSARELMAYHELPAAAKFLRKPFDAEELCDQVQRLLAVTASAG